MLRETAFAVSFYIKKTGTCGKFQRLDLEITHIEIGILHCLGGIGVMAPTVIKPNICARLITQHIIEDVQVTSSRLCCHYQRCSVDHKRIIAACIFADGVLKYRSFVNYECEHGLMQGF